MIDRKLEGLRILVVEDDFHQAHELKELLTEAGAMVTGPTGRAEQGREMIGHGVDMAVIDINLGRGQDLETARGLREQGIPFVFLTGYDRSAIPSEFQNVRSLGKPASAGEIIGTLAQIIRS
ncbi:response regulator [Qipengyuania spongiae]|uniref:Response regulator n=1 Tax=Qipengyuania spongiae TaxID=2909673 RepID=A0ABY5SX95_9SPHN|nr:response regulator [Qipengyuania spongiae]UVI39162.1 response regulator [Qipengyuania spongiae]